MPAMVHWLVVAGRPAGRAGNKAARRRVRRESGADDGAAHVRAMHVALAITLDGHLGGTGKAVVGLAGACEGRTKGEGRGSSERAGQESDLTHAQRPFVTVGQHSPLPAGAEQTIARELGGMPTGTVPFPGNRPFGPPARRSTSDRAAGTVRCYSPVFWPGEASGAPGRNGLAVARPKPPLTIVPPMFWPCTLHSQ